MNCKDFQEGVQQFLDGDSVGSADAFDEHCRACPECGATFAAARELVRGMRLAPWPSPPPELAPRIVGEILRDRTRQARRIRLGWAAVAAGVFLAVAAVAFMTGKGELGKSATGGLIVTSASRSTPVAGSLSLDVRVAEAGSALTSLVELTARQTVKQGQSLLPPNMPTPPLANIDTLQQKLEPSAMSLRQAGQTLTASLEPVTASARRAFVTFQDLSSVTGDERR